MTHSINKSTLIVPVFLTAMDPGLDGPQANKHRNCPQNKLLGTGSWLRVPVSNLLSGVDETDETFVTKGLHSHGALWMGANIN